MKRNHGCARAREAAADDWIINRYVDDREKTTGEALREGFVVGAEWGEGQAEADFAIERATGQRQLDDAAALINEACDLFQRYAHHHWARADGYSAEGDWHAAHDSLTKARTNLLMLVRLKEWLAGNDVFTVNPAEALRAMAVEMAAELGLTVDHAAFDDAAAYLTAPVEHHVYMRDQPGLDCGDAGHVRLEGWAYMGEDEQGRGVWFRPAYGRECRLTQADRYRIHFLDEGRQARRDGKGIEDCPHPAPVPGGRDQWAGVSPAAEWIHGWQEEDAGPPVHGHFGCDGRYRHPPEASNVKLVTTGPLADPALLDAVLQAIELPHAAFTMACDLAFRIQTPDPRFDPTKPVVVNGYLFTPATEA